MTTFSEQQQESIGEKLPTCPPEGYDLSKTIPPSEAATAEKAEESVREEGGARAWLTVLGSALIYFASFGIISSFGFFQNYYRDHLLKDVPASTISLVGTVQMLLTNVLAGPTGSLSVYLSLVSGPRLWRYAYGICVLIFSAIFLRRCVH